MGIRPLVGHYTGNIFHLLRHLSSSRTLLEYNWQWAAFRMPWMFYFRLSKLWTSWRIVRRLLLAYWPANSPVLPCYHPPFLAVGTSEFSVTIQCNTPALLPAFSMKSFHIRSEYFSSSFKKEKFPQFSPTFFEHHSRRLRRHASLWAVMKNESFFNRPQVSILSRLIWWHAVSNLFL